MSLRPFSLAILVALPCVAACGDANGPRLDHGGPLLDATGPGSATTTDAGPGDAAPVAAPCDDQETAALQTDIDGAAAAAGDFDFVMVVKTPACGTRFFSAGPSKYSDTTLEIIGSATKTYVAAAAMKLVEDGKLSLEDPIATWIPNAPGGDAIKVRNIIQHTSGIHDYFDSLGLLQQAKAASGGAFTPQELVNAGLSRGPDFQPDAKWAYSNTNFIALGIIVEAVAAKPLAETIHTMLLAPLGLQQTFYSAEETVAGTVAVGRKADRTPETKYHPSFLGAAGAMVVKPSNLADWIEALCSGKVLKPESDAPTYLKTGLVEGWNYGYGLVHFDAAITNGGGAACGHAGNWPGYQTEDYYFPSSRTTVIATYNGPRAAPVRDVLVPAVEKTLFGGVK